MKRQPFDFGKSGDTSPVYSKPIARVSSPAPVRVDARSLGHGLLNVELQRSEDLENWTFVDAWQAPSPGTFVSGPVCIRAAWLRAKVSSGTSALAFAVALLEDDAPDRDLPLEPKEDDHGR